ncbi:MAG: hypothetical protein IKR06_04475, partial [Erysipelotrichaceae bacterium]|nr:hypothetical protein [Erysipelotrichaceae bacterium]
NPPTYAVPGYCIFPVHTMSAQTAPRLILLLPDSDQDEMVYLYHSSFLPHRDAVLPLQDKSLQIKEKGLPATIIRSCGKT